MQKYFYPIFKIPEYSREEYNKRILPRWIKWYLYNKNLRELSEILTGSSFTLQDSVRRKFAKFEIGRKRMAGTV